MLGVSQAKITTMVIFRGRKDKLEIVGQMFSEWLRGTVLDVGCDQRILEKFVAGRYVGIDIAGRPDVYVDLERGIPFQDKSFDTVVCFDVLEHIECIHKLFDELCRVSRDVVIVGLPNMYEFRFRIAHLVGRRISGKYGLPVEYPSDRHRWFFSAKEAREFVYYRGQQNGFRITKEVYGFYQYRRIIPKLLNKVSVILGKRFFNLFAYHYWAVLRRQI